MNNKRKLPLGEKVEVRQFDQGLRGSWHPGVVVDVADLCRSVTYDELLDSDGSKKLTEHILVTRAIEGKLQHRHVRKTYRGRIRPLPPQSEQSLKHKLSFGTCVDVFVEDAWWEGVVLDLGDDLMTCWIYFPDEAIEGKYKVSNLRPSLEWDELLDCWMERGIWELVNLVKEHRGDAYLVKAVWHRLWSKQGFKKIISTWTCYSCNSWRRHVTNVFMELAVESSLQDHIIPKTQNCKKPKPSIPYFDSHNKAENSYREQQSSTVLSAIQNQFTEEGHQIHNNDQHDTVCMVCHDGGNLILCDHCPSTYHLTCINLTNVPDGEWFCPTCRCGLCGVRDSSSKNRLFTGVCQQCSRQYHVDCLTEAGVLLPRSLPTEIFCSQSCFELCEHLHQMLGSPNLTNLEGLTWTLIRSRENDCNMNETKADMTSCLSHASELLKECVLPAISPHYKADLVDDIIFNSVSILKRLDFRGFYIIVLQHQDEIISTAAVRIHGHNVAEMPLACTRSEYRGQGMFRLLLLELQKMLTQLGVEKLVVPATPAMEKKWETSYGFTQPSPSERLDLINYPLLNFLQTKMFQKVLDGTNANEGYNGLILCRSSLL